MTNFSDVKTRVGHEIGLDGKRETANLKGTSPGIVNWGTAVLERRKSQQEGVGDDPGVACIHCPVALTGNENPVLSRVGNESAGGSVALAEKARALFTVCCAWFAATRPVLSKTADAGIVGFKLWRTGWSRRLPSRAG